MASTIGGIGGEGAGVATVGSGYSTTAISQVKCNTLAKKNPGLAQFVANTFGLAVQGANAAAGSVNNAGQDLDRYTKNVLQTIFSAENYLGDTVGNAATGAASGISAAGNSISSGISQAKQDLNELLKPVSSFTGSTLGTLTNLLKDPTGPVLGIPNAIASTLDRVSKGLVNKIDATLKKYKVDDLLNLPTTIMGGVRNLLSIVDKLLAVPFQIMQDLYNGVMQIMSAISGLVDDIIGSIIDFFFGPGGLLDSLFPFSALLELLDAVSGIVGLAGGVLGEISSITGGFSMVQGILGQAQGFLGQATSILSNPAALAQSYISSAIGSSGAGQILSALRNPQQLLSSMLPPQVSGLLGQIGGASGLGFGSNLMYGFEGIMSGLGQNVIGQIMGNYPKLTAILSPVLGLGQMGNPAVNPSQGYPPGVDSSSIGGQAITQGNPVDLAQRDTIFPTGAAAQLQKGGNPSIYPFWNDLNSRHGGLKNYGIWGDKAHQARKSDHNTGDALDVGINNASQGKAVYNDIVQNASRNNVKYVIHQGKIWSPGKGERPYTGSNPHNTHVHVSFNR